MLPNHENRIMSPTKSQPVLPGEEIVISGISGRFPNAENIQVFSDKLYNKVRRAVVLFYALGRQKFPTLDFFKLNFKFVVIYG